MTVLQRNDDRATDQMTSGCRFAATHRDKPWRLIRTSRSADRQAKQGRQDIGYRRTHVRGNIKRGVMENLV